MLENARLIQSLLPPALEWHGFKTESSLVYIQLNEDKVIKVLDGKLAVVRSITLRSQQKVETIMSHNRGSRTILLKIPKEYDLVCSKKDDGQLFMFWFICWKGSHLAFLSSRTSQPPGTLGKLKIASRIISIKPIILGQLFNGNRNKPGKAVHGPCHCGGDPVVNS